MNWHGLVQKQISYCTEHPTGSAASTAIFGFFAGMQVSELWFRQHPAPRGEYVFVLAFVIMATGQAYFLARTLRLLLANKEQTD